MREKEDGQTRLQESMKEKGHIPVNEKSSPKRRPGVRARAPRQQRRRILLADLKCLEKGESLNRRAAGEAK